MIEKVKFATLFIFFLSSTNVQASVSQEFQEVVGKIPRILSAANDIQKAESALLRLSVWIDKYVKNETQSVAISAGEWAVYHTRIAAILTHLYYQSLNQSCLDNGSPRTVHLWSVTPNWKLLLTEIYDQKHSIRERLLKLRSNLSNRLTKKITPVNEVMKNYLNRCEAELPFASWVGVQVQNSGVSTIKVFDNYQQVIDFFGRSKPLHIVMVIHGREYEIDGPELTLDPTHY